MQLGVGLVAFDGSVERRGQRTPFEGKGPSSHFGVMLGGTPARGLVVGGGLAMLSTPPARDRSLYRSDPQSEDTDSLVGLMYGFVDYFPDPRKGLHFGGGLGPAGLQYTTNDYGIRGNTTGASALLWAGYDLWTGEKWSIGAEARAFGVHFWPDADKTTSHRISVGGAALMLSALLH